MKNPETYTFNEHGVCTNPTVILQKKPQPVQTALF